MTTLVRRMKSRPDCVQIGVLLAAPSIDLPMRDDKPTGLLDELQILTAQAKLKRVGREMKMVVDGDNHCAADPSLLRVLARVRTPYSRASFIT